MAPAPFIVEVNIALRRTQGRGWRAVTKPSLVRLQQQCSLPLQSNRLRPWLLEHKLVFAAKNSSSRAALLPSSGSSQRALPNPSLKPSPNGKPPGRRYSALSLLLQRRPGAFPLVPA
jgi:hypothetical protein